MSETTDHKLLRYPELHEYVPWSRSHVMLKVRRGEFPPPIRLGENSIAWRRADVLAWIASRVEVAV